MAGLVLLAGLASDFPTALDHVSGSNGANGNVVAPGPASGPGVAGIAEALCAESTPSILMCALRFVLLRVLPLGTAIVGELRPAHLPFQGRNEPFHMGGHMGRYMRGHMGGDCRHLAREGHRQPIGGHLYGRFCDAMFQTGVVNTPMPLPICSTSFIR